MGLGDVRLAALIGAGLGWLGLLHVYVGFVVGFLAGALFGIVVMAARGTGRKTKLPFAPALAIGAVVGVLRGSAARERLAPRPRLRHRHQASVLDRGPAQRGRVG